MSPWRPPGHRRVDQIGDERVDVQGESGPVSDPPEAPSPRTARRRLSVWHETLLLLAGALVLSFVVKTFLVQAFYIPSGSMEPGLEVDDRILVQKVSYWGGGDPGRGEVVVFEDPGGWLGPDEDAGPTSPLGWVLGKVGLYPSGGHLVKRVIGVAGDVIECCDEQGRLLVNGEPVGSDFTSNRLDCDGPMVTDCAAGWSAGPVPEGHLFVMGDHRDASADSSARLCRADETDCAPGAEFVPVDLVVGKVFARVWPADRMSFLHTPDAFADLD